MDAKLIAALACGTALLLGACSGNNASGTTGGGGQAGTGPDSNGNGGSNGGAGSTELQTAADRLSKARTDAMRAVEAARLAVAADTVAARANAEALIAAASTALDEAVRAADAAVEAAAGGSAAGVGAAARARTAAMQLKDEQTELLDDARDSLAWFGRTLARYELANGEAVTPREGINEVTINRIPRTINTSATNSAQKRNPAAFCRTSFEPDSCDEDTFKTVMHEDGKKLFSDVDVEFKVDGYTQVSFSNFGTETYVLTGVKLTRDGLVIRTGGGLPSVSNVRHADFTDRRRNIKYKTDDSDQDGSARQGGGETNPTGQNAWDLEITFDAPRTMPVPDAPDGKNWVASWQGNGDFYWKAIVPAAESQLETDGDYYESDAFLQPDGFKDLGTYQVWLSNHVGVNRNLEPAAGREGTCPDGSRGTSCPYDDEQYYLEYAAYGLFAYTADPETVLGSVGDGRVGRAQSLHFGYSAFADEENKRTTNIGEAITGGRFKGQALAYAFKGHNLSSYPNEFKMLRGDATLTVTIPKTGNGTITGTLNNFKEWTAAGWRVYGTNFNVSLTSGVIMTSGEFTGTATATGGVNLSSGAGAFKGAFYGPRDDSADLEVAGSWSTGHGEYLNPGGYDMMGSFGAKQRSAPALADSGFGG